MLTSVATRTGLGAVEPDGRPRFRLAEGVRLRREAFGGIVYVSRRDHFFALDKPHFKLLVRSGTQIRTINVAEREKVTTLAELGICVTEPATPQRAFYGRSLVGQFDGLPTCRKPLVVNCFATAHCPLRCVYCHADDLMVNYRGGEDDSWLKQVVRVAVATPAMVGVVTGGEPLSRPARAETLIRALARDKAVVLDTSGVGNFTDLVPLLHRYGVHVRVSMDSADQRVNDRQRPINRRALPLGTSAYVHARRAIESSVAANLPCSVQTVVTARNNDLDDLLRMRDLLVGLGVQTWVLHVVVPAGKAAEPRQTNLLSRPETVGMLSDLVGRSASDRVALDIRVTSTHHVPNSVLLVSAKGELCIESPDSSGKVVLTLPSRVTGGQVLRRFAKHVDRAGHASRYLNGALNLYPEPTGAVLRHT